MLPLYSERFRLTSRTCPTTSPSKALDTISTSNIAMPTATARLKCQRCSRKTNGASRKVTSIASANGISTAFATKSTAMAMTLAARVVSREYLVVRSISRSRANRGRPSHDGHGGFNPTLTFHRGPRRPSR